MILGVSRGFKLCATFLNIAKYLKTVWCGCGYFFNLLKARTVLHVCIYYSDLLAVCVQSGRQYSTKVMRVFLRARVQNFHQWGIELLTAQLYDQCRGVAMTALSILDEACEVKVRHES